MIQMRTMITAENMNLPQMKLWKLRQIQENLPMNFTMRWKKSWEAKTIC